MQEHDGALVQLGPDGREHLLGAVAAPVVGVDVPPAQLELVRGGDLRGPRRLRAPRRAPAARAHPEARQRRQRAARVVLDRRAVDLGVADVLVAVQLDRVAGGADRGDELRVRGGARRDDEERRAQRRAAQRRQHGGRPDGIGPVVERQLDGACEGGSHCPGSSRSRRAIKRRQRPVDRVGRTHVRHERRGALAPHGMRAKFRSPAAAAP